MKTSQCDKKRIDEFFQNERLDLDIELARHLEVCEECRGYFDSQAAQPSLWMEAQKMLQPTEFDRASSAEFSAGGQDPLPVHAPPPIQTVLDSLNPSDDPTRLGRLGTYEVSGVIGAGGMGVVLKAIDPSLDRVVAIKVLAPHLANNGTARKRFSREAKAAAAVLHPNVIPIHSVSSEATSPYLVMAYIRGGSLQKRVDREGPLSTVEILRIGSQVAAGLAAAHEQGLIHRDVKPENILLEEGVERVTLTDFGLARAVDDASVTREGTIAGTPQYMSPEQARGESIDQRSDLFSLGSVLYSLCTGRPPFRADSTYAVMKKIIDEQPLPILELNPDIPAWLVCVVEMLMAKKQAHRFQKASEVHEVLEACLQVTQQPGAVKLPAWLAKKAKPRFGRIFAAPFSRVVGLIFMLIVTIAIVLGTCFFPDEPGLLPQTNQSGNEAVGIDQLLGHGYVRKGAFIFFDGQRIDQAGKDDIAQFAKFTQLELKLAEDVDPASFKALSEEYTKDRRKVYYKWISPGRFWVVELPQANASSFEVLGFNFAKDSESVWWYGQRLPEVDPSTVRLVNEGFVWKDATSVWYQHEKIAGADAETFRHLEQAFYRDKDRVYWSSHPLTNADPNTFRTFGDDSPYGADRTTAWKASTKLTGVDGATFEAVHQSVYKDKSGVYANGYPVFDADPTTFRKVADLDESFTALLTDRDHFYVFLPYRGEVYQVTPASDSLEVKRQIWAPGTPQHRKTEVGPVAIAMAELGATGWRNQSVVVDGGADASQVTRDQEAHLLNIYKERFAKAWQILRNERNLKTTSEKTGGEGKLDSGNLATGSWRTDIAAFDKYLSQLADAGKVPDKSALAKRVTLIPGGRSLKSEVIPVTDGAGGFIDLEPAEGTVQFNAIEALNGQTVTWEFELQSDATESFAGAFCLIPKIADGDGEVPTLGSLFVKPGDPKKFSGQFKAGDTLKLEGTIGDFSANEGIEALQSPSGPVALYHLEFTQRTVFWIGLTEVTIATPAVNANPQRLKPTAEITALARKQLGASLRYDEQQLKAVYAPEVQLLPGNRLFQYGLELPGKMTPFGVKVDRDQMLPALKKQADRTPILSALVPGVVNFFKIEQLGVPAGEFVTEPNQPGESVFDKLRFSIQENDVLLKVSVPNAFRYLQIRKIGDEWKVVAEY